jgi:hypothetical protein
VFHIRETDSSEPAVEARTARPPGSVANDNDKELQ